MVRLRLRLRERIYVGGFWIGSDWGSVSALGLVCFLFFSFFAIVVFFSGICFSLWWVGCSPLHAFALLLAGFESGFLVCFDAFEAKKDLFWRRVLWGFSHKAIFQSLLVLERGFHLI